MSFKAIFLRMLLLFSISLSLFGVELPFNSLEEFKSWERSFKMNARFHPNYKTPDYYFIGLWRNEPEAAESRYRFLKNNPQYAADYEAIHKGELSKFPTDGSSMIKSDLSKFPPEIAEYYKQHPDELLAAEGFGHDPVLARKLYTGEIQLDKNINKSEWLRTHAWTPDGIVEKNNVVDYAQKPYGDYKLQKIDPATGKGVEEGDEDKVADGETKNSGVSEQVKGNLELYNRVQKDIDTIVGKINVLRESIGVTLATSEGLGNSVDCAGQVPATFKGRCGELKVLVKSFKDLEAQAAKLREVISAVDSSIGFPKIARDMSIATTVVSKTSKNVFAADRETPDCTLPSQKGWKCLKTTIRTLEGKNYKIVLKWNRPNVKSRGTVFYGIGGAGMGESLDDAPSKAVMDQLDQIDQVRIVALEMLDEKPEFPLAGGYWIHGGGYETLAQIFMASFELAVKKNLIHGSFLNYMGGSNGTMLLASAMARYNADTYFDRVVFQMGPFLPSLEKACDKNSSSHFWLSTPQQVNMMQDFLSRWTYQDPAKKVCDDLKNDRLSLLKKDLKKDYPNTIIHVIMGEKEITDGFGKWILESNLEWYNAITSKSKERLLRPQMGHNNSYEDMRRFLKLAPNETPDRSLEQCQKGTFDVDGKPFEFSCGCGTVTGGVLQNDGCFHKAL